MSESDGIAAWFGRAGARGKELRRTDALIVAAARGIDRQPVPSGSSAMLGYGLMPYRPRSGKETTMWPLIAVAAQERQLALHVWAVVDGEYPAGSRAGRLGKVSCGKSRIRSTSLDDVDAEALRAVVRDAVAVTAAGDNRYSAS